ncbi:hypothetical protein LJC10_06245 [Selenomonadales bacterium OttesenSCG-928-I06]|nr:hypothetical protein [Selenomonadales bacterium OttesenSCG-928-I06]
MKKLLTIILICVLAIGFTNIAKAADWLQFGSNDEQTIFFDTQSFQKTGDTTYAVWFKRQYTDAYKKEEIKKNNYNPPAYDLCYMEFNYLSKKNKILSLVSYDSNNNVIRSIDEPSFSKWENIVPNSMGANMFKMTYYFYKEYHLSMLTEIKNLQTKTIIVSIITIVVSTIIIIAGIYFIYRRIKKNNTFFN